MKPSAQETHSFKRSAFAENEPDGADGDGSDAREGDAPAQDVRPDGELIVAVRRRRVVYEGEQEDHLRRKKEGLR